MELSTVAALGAAFFAIAALYAAVGQAGASGYLAAMAVAGLAPDAMRPAALALNVVVASVAAWKFHRAGKFTWGLFWPFALASAPMAFVGGLLALPASVYKPVVGAALALAAIHLIAAPPRPPDQARPPAMWLALIVGAGIGLLSGLTGVGGGVFLGPLLIIMGWSDARQAAGVSAPFILVNSAAGLLGQVSSAASLPPAIPIWMAGALLGGWIGAEHGSKRLSPAVLHWLLAAVLAIGAVKLVAL